MFLVSEENVPKQNLKYFRPFNGFWKCEFGSIDIFQIPSDTLIGKDTEISIAEMATLKGRKLSSILIF